MDTFSAYSEEKKSIDLSYIVEGNITHQNATQSNKTRMFEGEIKKFGFIIFQYWSNIQGKL